MGEKLFKLTISLLVENIWSSSIRVYCRENAGEVWFWSIIFSFLLIAEIVQ